MKYGCEDVCLYFQPFAFDAMNSYGTGLRVQYQGFRKDFWHAILIFSPILIWLSMGWLQSGELFDRALPAPSADKLTKLGPMGVTKGRERSVEKLYFSFNGNSRKYSYESRWLHSTGELEKLLAMPNAHPVAYLWVNDESNRMKVWRITIDGVEVLSYSNAVYAYETTMNADEKLKIATILIFAIGLVRFFKIVRN